MYNDHKGKKSYPPKKRFGNMGTAPQSLHEATCAKCNKTCQVPFKPNGRKPIYCSDCFRRDEGTTNHRFTDRKNNHSDKPMYQAPVTGHDHVGDELKAINEKLDAIIDALSE